MSRNAWSDVLLIILSLFVPPIAVAIRRGLFSADFVINVALCILGFVPGLIHAFYLLAKYPRRSSEPASGEQEPLLP